MTLVEILIVLLVIYSIISSFLISYLYASNKSLENAVYNFPSVEEIAQKVMETKVPIIMGPDGPIVGTSKSKKQDERPIMFG